MNQKLNLGRKGEEQACRYLQGQGYKIVARNFRFGRWGEIDIIAWKGPVLTFIEVKARHSRRYGTPIEAVTWVKQQRIRRCAQYFLLQQGLLAQPPLLSFDIITLEATGYGELRLKHYPNMF